MTRLAFALLPLCLLAAPALTVSALTVPALAQTAPAPVQKGASSLLGKHDNNQPINIAADKVAADLNAKSVTYAGNVVVTQGDVRMHANTMKVSTANGKADKIYADGKVVVDSPATGTATGDSGVYDVTPRTVTLTGHVVLTHGKGDVLRGNKLLVNLVTGQASVVDAKETGGSGRVQGVFTPQSAN